MKQAVVTKDAYTMYVELHEGCWFFHVDVHEWTPKVKKDYLVDMQQVHQVFQPLFAVPEDTGDKMEKFCKVTGFNVIGYYLCDDNVERKVYEYKGVQ